MGLKVGFTGTREGMTQAQKVAFRSQIADLHGGLWPEPGHNISAFHHGCCIGADEAAHWLVFDACTNVAIIGHPPIKTQWRMSLVGGPGIVYRDPQGYLVRDRAIVDAVDILIAAPKEMERPASKRAGGTWYTYGYAEGKCARVLILPDGTIYNG